MRRFILAPLAAALLVMLSVSATLGVGLHQHVVTTPSGQEAWIGQGICRNDLQNAIDNLHANFHLGAPAAAFATNGVSFAVTGCP